MSQVKIKPINEGKSITPSKGKNIQFDSLRGLWALSVVFVHIEMIRYYFDLSDNYLNPVIEQWGSFCVTGFFVLSGYLITINLMKLKDRAGTSAGGKTGLFYYKRILRVWPLYFLLILLSIYAFPHFAALTFKLPQFIIDARPIIGHLKGYYLGFLPQVPLAKRIVLPFAEPTWSVGVEEIFYLIIPLYILFVGHSKRALAIVALLFVLVKAVIFEVHPTAPIYGFVYNFLAYSRFECILVGCIAGMLFYEQNGLLQKINAIHILVATVVIIASAAATHGFYYLHTLVAVAFSIIIIYVSTRSVIFLNNKILAFFGTISFSMYLSHEVAIVFLLNNKYLSNLTEGNDLLLYLLTLVLSTALAFVVFKLIEEPFIKLKDRVRLKSHVRDVSLS